jgi:hypothetical protein
VVSSLYANFGDILYISRTHRFLNLTVPDMKIIGVRRRLIRPNIIPVPCRAILQRSLGLGNEILKQLNHKPDQI